MLLMAPVLGEMDAPPQQFCPTGWELAEVGVVPLSRSATQELSCLTPSCLLMVSFTVELINFN